DLLRDVLPDVDDMTRSHDGVEYDRRRDIEIEGPFAPTARAYEIAGRVARLGYGLHGPPVEDLDVEHIGTLPQHVLVAEATQASKAVIDKDDSGVVGDDDGVIGEVNCLEKGVALL